MNNLRHQLPDPPVKDAFRECKLDRKKYAEILTAMVSHYRDGFVLALNGQWGSGKTTFVKMWQQYLIDDKFNTLYFNAWENDFEDDALVALLAELSALHPDSKELVYKTLLEKSAALTREVLPSLFKAAAMKIVGNEGFAEIAEAATKFGTNEMTEKVNHYSEKKNQLLQFRSALTTYVNKLSPEKPLIFFIDELDRCKPSYAVALLERIKHLFAVDGIVFVLSIDKKQLENAIRGYYGNSEIDAPEYLRRFIDYNFQLPTQRTEEVVAMYYHHFGLHAFFEDKERLIGNSFQSDPKNFFRFAFTLFDQQQLPLRQIEKIMATCSVILRTFRTRQYVMPEVLLFLIFIKDHEDVFYYEIKNGSLTLGELSEKLQRYDKQYPISEAKNHFLFMTGILYCLYTNRSKSYSSEGLVKIIENNIELHQDLVVSDIVPVSRAIQGFNNNFDIRNMDLGWLIERIDLTKPLQFT
jgi:energy-coupling factor transporter ATP-binding protein EcfA2